MLFKKALTLNDPKSRNVQNESPNSPSRHRNTYRDRFSFTRKFSILKGGFILGRNIRCRANFFLMIA